MRRFLLAPLFLSSLAVLPSSAADNVSHDPSEIPYYLRQLQEATTDGKRVEFVKIIHEAIVDADLSDKKVVKKMEPMIEKTRAAIQNGWDRPYLEGSSMWLASAVAYFEREKLRPVLDVPSTDWLPAQTETSGGLRISTFPDKILLHEGGKSRTIVESSNIHEAVISPSGRRVAFVRKTEERPTAEIWTADTRTGKRKKIASLPSCYTLLYSLDGDRLFLQEAPGEDGEATLHALPAGGGKPKALGKIRLLETVIAKGPYQGGIVVYKATPHHLGTATLDCAYALDESGREKGRLKGVCR